jgi:DNA replication protein DnaC
MPELSPLLKQLRLSGILETLPVRNREAIENKLSYTEFLALVIQDEVARREQNKFVTRVRRAGFRGEKTLEGFDFSFNPHIDQAYLKDLATCRFIAEKVAVLIAGPSGTGKSHIAQALGHCAVRAGCDVLFTTQSKLLGNLHAARATGNFERRFQAMAKIPLLIIDDFGLKPLRAPHEEDFHDLVGERYERAAVIITSNLDFEEWGEAFANQLLGAATLDRLRHGAYRVVLDGESYRKPRPLPKFKNSAAVSKRDSNKAHKSMASPVADDG